MKRVKRIGILTAGGDCPGLNAAIRGVGKAVLGRNTPHALEYFAVRDRLPCLTRFELQGIWLVVTLHRIEEKVVERSRLWGWPAVDAHATFASSGVVTARPV